MDLNFLIGKLALNEVSTATKQKRHEEERAKAQPPTDIVGLVKRINTEKHAKGERISAEHLATVQHLIKTHKASGEDIDLFHKHISAYPKAEPKESLVKGWLDSHAEAGDVAEPEKPILKKEEPSETGASKKHPFGTFVDKDEHIALGGGHRVKATGRMKGGMVQLNAHVHTDDNTGLADPGGIFHSKAKFFNKPAEDGTPGSPVRWFSNALYLRLGELRTKAFKSGPENAAENMEKKDWRDELSRRVNHALVHHKIEGKNLRQHSADLPDDEVGQKTFEHHAGAVLDHVVKDFSTWAGWSQQRSVMTVRKDAEGNPVLDDQGDVIEDPKRKRAPLGKGLFTSPQSKKGVTTPDVHKGIPNAGSKKYAKPEVELKLPPLEASDAVEPTPVRPPRTKSVDDLIAQTVERAKKSKTN